MIVNQTNELLERILTERRKKWEAEQLAIFVAKGKSPKDDNWKKKYKEPKPPDISDSPELPEGWLWTTIEQLGFVKSGNTPKGIKEIANSGDIPWFKVGDMNRSGNEKWLRSSEVNLSKQEAMSLGLRVFGRGTVVFPKRGGAIATNKKRVLDQKSCLDLNVMGVEPTGISSAYLSLWFESLDLATLSDGSNVPQINHDDISPLLLPVSPTEEQEDIVAKVEMLFTLLDAGVESLQKAKALLKRYRQSVLKSAMEGKLTAEWREKNKAKIEPASELLKRILAERRKKWVAEQLAKFEAKGKLPKNDDWKKKYKEPEPPDNSGLPELPEGWVWTTIEQIGFVKSGNTPKGIREVNGSGDIPWFKVGDMNRDGNEKWLRLSQVNLSKQEAMSLGLRVFGQGTVVFPKRGGAIATNKKRVLKQKSCMDLNVMGVEPTGISSAYLSLWFESLDLATLSDGSNVPQINHDDISPLLIPVAPIEEQVDIVSKLEAQLTNCDYLDKLIKTEEKKSLQLRASILNSAFTGNLINCESNQQELQTTNVESTP